MKSDAVETVCWRKKLQLPILKPSTVSCEEPDVSHEFTVIYCQHDHLPKHIGSRCILETTIQRKQLPPDVSSCRIPKSESVRNCRGDHRQEEKCNLSTRISPPFPPPVNRVTPSPNLPPPGCQRSIVTRSCHSQPTQPPLPIPPKQCVTQPLKPVKLGPTSIVVKLEPLRKVG